MTIIILVAFKSNIKYQSKFCHDCRLLKLIAPKKIMIENQPIWDQFYKCFWALSLGG